MIPAFHPVTNVLPPYVGSPISFDTQSPYESTIREMCQRFGTSPQRREILLGLLSLQSDLAENGLTGFQWLNGSFMQNIERAENRPPNDIDVVTFLNTPTPDILRIKAALMDAFSPRRAKHRYRVDHYIFALEMEVVKLVDVVRYWCGLFSHTRTDIWKGMVRIPLGTRDDDTATEKDLRAMA